MPTIDTVPPIDTEIVEVPAPTALRRQGRRRAAGRGRPGRGGQRHRRGDRVADARPADDPAAGVGGAQRDQLMCNPTKIGIGAASHQAASSLVTHLAPLRVQPNVASGEGPGKPTARAADVMGRHIGGAEVGHRRLRLRLAIGAGEPLDRDGQAAQTRVGVQRNRARARQHLRAGRVIPARVVPPVGGGSVVEGGGARLERARRPDQGDRAWSPACSPRAAPTRSPRARISHLSQRCGSLHLGALPTGNQEVEDGSVERKSS